MVGDFLGFTDLSKHGETQKGKEIDPDLVHSEFCKRRHDRQGESVWEGEVMFTLMET